MVTSRAIFWAVDVQVDFMKPEGRLYVPGAEHLIPNIGRLIGAVRESKVFLISSADAHKADDREFQEWPPHCMKGTPGAELLPEACAHPRLIIPNRENFVFPATLDTYRQVNIEKNALDVFDNPNTDLLLKRLEDIPSRSYVANPLFVVFGVATDYCVRCTAEGLLKRERPLAIVQDAVRAIDEKKGRIILDNLQSRGAQLVTTEDALGRFKSSS